MSEVVDIDEQVTQLFEALGDIEGDAAMVPALLVHADRLRALAAACEQTELFRQSAEQYAAFQIQIEVDHEPADRLYATWVHFLDRALEAPTDLHRLAAVRICLPLVAHYLPKVSV
jgi:hypothetical protein